MNSLQEGWTYTVNVPRKVDVDSGSSTEVLLLVYALVTTKPARTAKEAADQVEIKARIEEELELREKAPPVVEKLDPMVPALRRLVVAKRKATVSTAELARAIRACMPTLTTRQIEFRLPRLMAVHFNCARSNDLRRDGHCVRGYRGVALRRTGK